jgi:tRNA pseudouridine13 synthase
MKLKQQPEDFQVEEQTDVVPGSAGPYAFYRLTKRGWTTPDALAAVRRRWQVDLRRVSYGGLKDRHAHSVQYVTIFHGPRRGLSRHRITLEYLGQVERPFTSQDIRSNRFVVTVRDLTPGEGESVGPALEEVRVDGVPNYFDDQRFGSVRAGGEFVARLLVLQRYEDALRQALAAPYEFDRKEQKKEKAVLLAHWGDWPVCKARLPCGHARSLVDYLVSHPGDFRGALARLRPELRGLYLSAYQSHLWNATLGVWVRKLCRADQIITLDLKLGALPAFRRLDAVQRTEWAALCLPLPSARCTLEPGDPRKQVLDAVLAREGLEPDGLKLKGLRDMFFSRGERAALCVPMELSYEIRDDERHPGRRKLVFSCELARGAYVTLIVKRISAAW